MSHQFPRREFCTRSFAIIVAHSMGAGRVLAAKASELDLIAVLSTGHTDDSIYIALEGGLKSSIPRFAERLKMERREAGFSDETLVAYANQLLARNPKVLICLDLAAASFAISQRTDKNIPIVFLAHDDPLASGLIKSYARPGNNVTGVTTFRCVDGKMVEIMVKAFPGRKRFGYLLDAAANGQECTRLAEQAAARAGIQLVFVDVSAANFAETMLPALTTLRLDAIIAPASTTLWQNRAYFVGQLNSLEIPVIYESERFLNEGGLMYYGPIREKAIEQLVSDVSKILMGESAGDLPVEQPTLFELVINLRAPHASQFGISPSTLRRADRILQ
jgi:putative ABC transport system substrate-binding protein